MPADAALFAALGDETRLALAERLATGPASIVRLTEGQAMSRQAVTKHLRVMEKAGLVHCRRLGRASVWELQTTRLDDARRHLDRMSQKWDAAIERLRLHVET